MDYPAKGILLDLDDAVGQIQDSDLRRFGSMKSNRNAETATSVTSLNNATEQWRWAMDSVSQCDGMPQISLYLLRWGGGAARVWFMPGCLCFTFKCAGGYHLSPECQSLVQQVKERLHLQTVIRPLCLLIHDRGYEVVDGRFVRK